MNTMKNPHAIFSTESNKAIAAAANLERCFLADKSKMAAYARRRLEDGPAHERSHWLRVIELIEKETQ